MDLSEKLFHYFIQKRSKKNQIEIEKKALKFADFEKYAETILNYFIPELSFEIRANDNYIGLIGQSFVLPRFYSVVDDEIVNSQCLKFLVIYQAMLIKYQLVSLSPTLSLQLKAVESACFRPFILREMKLSFANYFTDVMTLEKNLAMQTNLTGKEKQVFTELINLPIHSMDLSPSESIQQCRELFNDYRKNFKQNGEFQSPIWKIWGFLPDSVPQLKIAETSTLMNSNKKNLNVAQTEIEKKDTLQVEHVDLDKEKKSGNPVTHSFEKLETADEYNGGYRMDSGDDELNEHQAALDELNLKKVTRGGESAQSVYKADLLPQFFSSHSKMNELKSNQILLPEWSAQKQDYIVNYCKLEIKEDLQFDQSNFKEYLKNTYQGQINLWQKQIDYLLNSYGWKNRQYDGSEIDLDSFIRAFVDIKMKKNVDQKLYSLKVIQQQDFAVSILLDQSMSSDSWVNDRRILDVCLDSIGIMGLLFQDHIQGMSIQSTFSHGHQTCFLQKIKKAEEDWSHFYQRAQLIRPQGYTRLGPGIRYCLQELQRSNAKQKILIMLTDGRPTDIDGYEGLYGIQDIHQAMREAKQKNIHTYALTVDKESKNYFHKMFDHYHVLQSPDQLTEKLFLYLSQVLRSR